MKRLTTNSKLKTFFLPDFFDGEKVTPATRDHVLLGFMARFTTVEFKDVSRVVAEATDTLQTKITIDTEAVERFLHDSIHLLNFSVAEARELVEHSTKAIRKDQVLTHFLYVYRNYYLWGREQNFLIAKTVTDTLSKMYDKFNIAGKHLPDAFYGFFEFADKDIKTEHGDALLGTFVSLEKIGEMHVIGFAFVSDDHCHNSLLLNVYPDNTIKDVLSRVALYQISAQKEKMITGNALSNFALLLIQTMLFVNGNIKHLEYSRNEFSNKKKKRETQEKFYTKKPYIFVGRNFHERVFSKDEATVTGHWRWQPIGAKDDKSVKLVWIKEHQRKYRSIFRQKREN